MILTTAVPVAVFVGANGVLSDKHWHVIAS